MKKTVKKELAKYIPSPKDIETFNNQLEEWESESLGRIGLATPPTKKQRKEIDKIMKSKFADKDFDFNKFPSQDRVYKHTKELKKLLKEDKLKVYPTALPYYIEGDPVIQGCGKFTAMVVAIVLLAVFVYAAYGDNFALINDLIH